MDSALICRILEAALLASSQPLPLSRLHELFAEDEPPPKGAIEAALETLRQACEGRGVELVEVASGFRYQVRTEVQPWVARLWSERPARYTRAALETLALIAYRQPITRGEIEQIRGVAVSSNIIRLLEEREWIRVIGHRDAPGRPALFGTTRCFLDYFNLKSLDELPPLSELRELTELAPQLPLDGTVPDPAPANSGMVPGSDSGLDLDSATDVILTPEVIHTAAVHLPAAPAIEPESPASTPQGAPDDDAPEHIA